MKITVDASQPDYPVGSNIKLAKRLIGAYLTAFYKLGYPLSTPVNLWCRGSSGAILAAMFAMECGNDCKVVHIKKKGEDSHTFGYKFFDQPQVVNIVIDDFVASGTTIMAIVDRIGEYAHINDINIRLDVLMVMCLYGLKDEYKKKFTHLIGDP